MWLFSQYSPRLQALSTLAFFEPKEICESCILPGLLSHVSCGLSVSFQHTQDPLAQSFMVLLTTMVLPIPSSDALLFSNWKREEMISQISVAFPLIHIFSRLKHPSTLNCPLYFISSLYCISSSCITFVALFGSFSQYCSIII